jgi:hypothetical protein
MARAKTITIVYQNCHYGIYANNKKIRQIAQYLIGDRLAILAETLTAANVKIIQATAPYIKGVMLPDDLKKLKDYLVIE